MSTAITKVFALNRLSVTMGRVMSSQNVVILPTTNGQVAGKEETSKKTNQKYISFKGIPYAEPPVGDLRFAYPVPKENWSGVRECFEEGAICPQPFTKRPNSDDCLTLNVFTPKEIVKGKLPVMLWFHGGAFLKGCGHSEVFGPDYLLREDVVVVSFNYRLGALGYLNTEDDVIPPNIALEDQKMVMRWVKENIAQFGGDPENITVFGESAGGCNITSHLADPSTKGLYHKAISQSGSALFRWATNSDYGATRRRAFKLGSLLGCDTKDSRELAKFLRKQHPMAIVKGQFACLSKLDLKKMTLFAFQPCNEIDKPTIQEKYEKGEVNKVPTLLGFNSHEGFWYLNGADMKVAPDKQLATYNKNPMRILERLLPLECYKNDEIVTEASNKIKQFYFGNKDINLDSVYEFVNMITDQGFMTGMYDTAKKLSQAGVPVYQFQFSFDGELGMYRREITKDYKGVSHGDDINYLFNSCEPAPEPELAPDSREIIARNRFVKLWTNFAKYGNPTPKEHPSELLKVEWLKSTPEKQQYLDLGDEPVMKSGTYDERIKVWEDAYKYVEENYSKDKHRAAVAQ